MNVRNELISDIKTTLGLLSKYSDKNKVDISPIVSAVVDSTKGKNLIDLFVIREFIKDKTSSILSADLDEENAQMSDEAGDLDFDSNELDNMADDDAENPEDDAESENEKEANPEAKALQERKQSLLDTAEGYLQSIDLGINNIQNGDVDLSLVGQLIDLKALIQESVDKVNEADNSDNPDISSLNVLEAVLNNLEPKSEGNPEDTEQEITHSDENGNEVKGDIEKDENGDIVENDSSIDSIIRSVSAGSVEASTQITELVRKLNEIVENPEEYLNPNPNDEVTTEGLDEDAEAEDEDTETEGDKDYEGAEDIDNADSAEDGDNEDENEDEGPSAAEEFVDKVTKKDKSASTSSRRSKRGKPVVSGKFDEALEDTRSIFDFDEDDYNAIRSSRFDNKNGLLADDAYDDDYDRDFEDDDYDKYEYDDEGDDSEKYDAGGIDADNEFEDNTQDNIGMDDDIESFGDEDYSAEGNEGTTPYVDEVSDIDFNSDDLPDKYEDPEEEREDEAEREDLKSDINDIKDSFSSKLDELESKYSDNKNDENKDSLDSEDSLLSTDVSLDDAVVSNEIKTPTPYHKNNRKDTALNKANKATKTPDGKKAPFSKLEDKNQQGSTPIVGNDTGSDAVTTLVEDGGAEMASNMTMDLKRKGLESNKVSTKKKYLQSMRKIYKKRQK